METAYIKTSAEYNANGFITKMEMLWDGDSDFVPISKELIEDNIFDPIKRSGVYLGMRAVFGPFELRLMSINSINDTYLFRLDNKIIKNMVYLGSIEDEWDWKPVKKKENK